MMGIKTVLGFIRFELCVMAGFFAMIGYVLFNGLDLGVVGAFASVFLATGFVYSYNMITDREEDALASRINALAASEVALWIPGALAAAALAVAAAMSTMALVFCALIVVTGGIYSRFRLKEVFVCKTIYTGFGFGLAFLAGAASLVPAAILYYAILSVLIIAIALASDLRDHVGDTKAGIQTIPVKLGYKQGKNVMYGVLGATTALSVWGGFQEFYVMIPFFIAAYLLFQAERIKLGRMYLIQSVTCLLLVVIVGAL